MEFHAYCEAQCRAGRPWPKAESPSIHSRPAACPTCRGRCSSFHDQAPTSRSRGTKRGTRATLHALLRVKAEIATCQVLLAADGDQRVAGAYDTLVETARSTAGAEAHQAWNDDPIQTDAQMNMAALFDRLKPLRDGLETFEGDLARATLPRRQRAWRWMRGVDV